MPAGEPYARLHRTVSQCKSLGRARSYGAINLGLIFSFPPSQLGKRRLGHELTTPGCLWAAHYLRIGHVVPWSTVISDFGAFGGDDWVLVDRTRLVRQRFGGELPTPRHGEMLVTSSPAIYEALRVDRPEEQSLLKFAAGIDCRLPALADSLHADQEVSHTDLTQDHLSELHCVEDCVEGCFGFRVEELSVDM